MNVLLVVLAAGLVVALFFWGVRERHLRSWQRDIQSGYMCEFYTDSGILTRGEVIAATVDFVVILSAHGTFRRVRNEVFPCRS